MRSAGSEGDDLHDQYLERLARYVERGDSAALSEARELGQAAFSRGLGLPEVTALHERASLGLLGAPLGAAPTRQGRKANPEATSSARWQRAATMFRELISPFRGRLGEPRVDSLDLACLQAALRRQRETSELVDAEFSGLGRALSHDLMAPLRGIASFSQEVIEMAAPALDARSRKYLDYVRDSALEMTRQVEGLVELARLSSGELERSRVDLGALARESAQRLARREPERRVEFVCGSEEAASADPRLLRVVLDALLANAWKYSANRKPARIEFGAVKCADERAYFVRDDGVGFDPTLAHKLFLPFQRLHSPREFPGVGLGLAMVRRAVHRHGGRVWAENAADGGATFYFTLPALELDFAETTHAGEASAGDQP